MNNQSVPMRASARNMLFAAKAKGWTAEMLAKSFIDMPLDVCQKLLDGSAIIAEEDDITGKFVVYEPDYSSDEDELVQFDAFVRRCETHDWFWSYSDDPAVLRAWGKRDDDLHLYAKTNPLYLEVVKLYQEQRYSGEAFAKPVITKQELHESILKLRLTLEM